MEKIFRFLAYCQCLVGGKWRRGGGIVEMYIFLFTGILFGIIEYLLRYFGYWTSKESNVKIIYFVIIPTIIWYLFFSDKYLKPYINEYNELKNEPNFVSDFRKKVVFILIFAFFLFCVIAKLNFDLRWSFK